MRSSKKRLSCQKLRCFGKPCRMQQLEGSRKSNTTLHVHHPVHRLKALFHGHHKTPGYRAESVNGFTVINSFTAMLAAPSLGKPLIKVPNLKPLRFFFPPSYQHVKRFLSKCSALKTDLLLVLQIYCLQACMCAWTFYRMWQ